MNPQIPPVSQVDHDPSDDVDIDEDLALLVAELTDRLQKGQSVDIHQVCEVHPACIQNPALAKELIAIWGTIIVTDAIGSHEAAVVADSNPGSGESNAWRLPSPAILETIDWSRKSAEEAWALSIELSKSVLADKLQ